MLKRMLVSPWCTATFAFTLSLQVPPLLGVHRSCWEHVREAGAGSEPSGKGMLLVEAGVRVAGSGVAPVRAVGLVLVEMPAELQSCLGYCSGNL